MAQQRLLSRARGFTLVELLIVVIILAILAAIVVPQFNNSSQDAKEAALDSNLNAVRTAIELYRAQHGGKYPGDATAVPGGTCTATTKGTGTAGTAQSLIDQLKMATDANGGACSVADATNYKYGPYLRNGVPNEPINNKGSAAADITVTTTGAPITAGTGGGWAYDTKSGQFIMNSTATDSKSVAYSAH